MGYARHTNSDVKAQLQAKVAEPLPVLLGQFVEREFGHTFEYSPRQWPDETFRPELPHIVYVGDGQTRLAHVKKTIAYVLTGDGELQRWDIRRKEYNTEWVYECDIPPH
jgi:hypothetical protein